MNELVISTYIKIMKDGFVEHDRQESAARFLLESISMQEEANIMTNIDSKKISQLVSRKAPVPDDIKRASLKSEVQHNVFSYFQDKVIPDLNPYRKDDTFEELMNVIIQDAHISKKTKDRFRKLYDQDNILKFLVDTFLYSLQRENKKTANEVQHQDIPLLSEVNYKCPLKHVDLVKSIKGVSKKDYAITQIFPENLSSQKEKEFMNIYPKPDNLNDPSNLIALSTEASENYLINPTVEEYENLYNIKKNCSRNVQILDDINKIKLEEEIIVVLKSLSSLTNTSALINLKYEALRIDEKIDDILLKNEIQTDVLYYYRYIESVFSDSVNNFDEIANEVRLCSKKLENAGYSQEEVIKHLVDWIHNKAFIGTDTGRQACKIVVSFFIQNCEVFYK